jgi:hypothetical protein
MTQASQTFADQVAEQVRAIEAKLDEVRSRVQKLEARDIGRTGLCRIFAHAPGEVLDVQAL